MKLKIIEIVKELVRNTIKTAIALFKIMIPVSIIVKILQETGLIHYVGDALNPFMKIVGLPGEMGFVWATTMITNIYCGLIVFVNMQATAGLTIAQVTVLTTMMLVAHTFPIEVQVAKKAGAHFITMALIRFVFAIILGAILYQIYHSLGYLQEKAVITWTPKIDKDTSLLHWAYSELKNYGLIVCMIFTLLTVLKILDLSGFIKVITRIFHPVLGLLGIGPEVINITIFGLTLGLVYGGALIINETREKKLNFRDVLYDLMLMGLCHSLIEDSLLMIAVGGHYSAVFIGRMIFAFAVMFIFVRITRNMSDKTFTKYFMKKN